MNGELTPLEKRLRFAAGLVLLGLVIEAFTLLSNHPLSFVFFMMPGLLLIAVGIVIFLLALVHAPAARTEIFKSRSLLHPAVHAVRYPADDDIGKCVSDRKHVLERKRSRKASSRLAQSERRRCRTMGPVFRTQQGLPAVRPVLTARLRSKSHDASVHVTSPKLLLERAPSDERVKPRPRSSASELTK